MTTIPTHPDDGTNHDTHHILPVPEVIVAPSSLATANDDPPPPYPSRERRMRTAGAPARRFRTLNQHQQRRQQLETDLLPPRPIIQRRSSTGGVSELEYAVHMHPSDDQYQQHQHYTGIPDAHETTPLLSPSHSGGGAIGSGNGNGTRPVRRQRTLSLSSTVPTTVISLSPSFSETIISAFRPARDADLDPDCPNEDEYDEDDETPDHDHSHSGGPVHHYNEDGEIVDYPSDGDEEHHHSGSLRHHGLHNKSKAYWRLQRYFRPLRIRAYYSALFHLLILNLPYAILAWVYLFVFTLVGTTSLMALPLGAVLCFLDLLGARVLARGELALQTTFHGPLIINPTYAPPPIFTRVHLASQSQSPEPSQAQAEMGRAGSAALVRERSFYKNTYSMCTDPTSYQSIFYFLVIKPGITLFFTLVLLVLVPISFVLVFPAPAMLRLARRLGIWQANVAVEGLYLTVR